MIIDFASTIFISKDQTCHSSVLAVGSVPNITIFRTTKVSGKTLNKLLAICFFLSIWRRNRGREEIRTRHSTSYIVLIQPFSDKPTLSLLAFSPSSKDYRTT